MDIESSISYEDDDRRLTTAEIAFLKEDISSRKKSDHRLNTIIVTCNNVEVDCIDTQMPCSGETHTYKREDTGIIFISTTTWVA